jgi:cell division protein FtsI/penicillin-binding protein 2
MLYPPIDPATERRARLMLRILAVWGVLIFGRMVYLQVIQHKHYATLADSQQIKMVEIPAHRGAIYDRTGHALALTIPTEKVVVNPSKIKDFGVAAGILSSVLGLEEKKLYEELRRRAGWKKEVQNGKEVEVFYPQQPGRSYFVVARHVHPELAHRMHG